MPKINLLWLWTGIYIVSALVFAFGLGFAVRRLPDIQQPRSDSLVWIYGNNRITQNITPVHNGLNVITVYMRNIGLRNRKPLTFALADPSGKVIREINITGYNAGDGDSVRFQFVPIPDSGGKTYTIIFSSPASEYADAIGVGYSDAGISYQTYYYPLSRLTVVADVVVVFLTALMRPEFLILFIAGGLISLIFSLYLFEYNNLA